MSRNNARVSMLPSVEQQKLITFSDLALAFSLRSNTYIVSSALLTWRQVHASHRNALTFAVHYHSAQLRFKMLLTWRLRLRSKLQMVKQGRAAQKFLISRRAWNIWTDKLEERRRQNKLRDLERRKMRKYFFGESKPRASIVTSSGSLFV
jgi:protein SFI1